MTTIVLRGGPRDGQVDTADSPAGWLIAADPHAGPTFVVVYRVTDEWDGEGRRVLVYEGTRPH